MVDPTNPEIEQGSVTTVVVLTIAAIVFLIVAIMVVRRMGVSFFG